MYISNLFFHFNQNNTCILHTSVVLYFSIPHSLGLPVCAKFGWQEGRKG